MIWHLITIGLGLMLGLGLLPGRIPLARAGAAGMTCTVAGPTLNLPPISSYGGNYPYSTSGNLAVTCRNTNSAATLVAGCFSFGIGSGGTTATNRTLASGSNTLGFRLTNGSTDIGDGTGYAMYGPFSGNVTGSGGTLNGNLPVAVSVPSPSTTPAAGSYSTTFSGTSAMLYYITYTGGTPTCAAILSSSPATTQLTMPVNANVPTQCTVVATKLAFPTTSLLSNAVAAVSTVTTSCNASVAVTVALDNGATGSGPTARQMKSGSNIITYGIYQDSAYSMPWGNTAGTNTVSVPSGNATLNAYGRVPAQTSQAPGAYMDVVNVIISY
jgi:spore coat protein U-like protein